MERYGMGVSLSVSELCLYVGIGTRYHVSMKIIVNGDDAGLHQAVNRALKALVERKIMTSASLTGNGEAVEEAAEIRDISLGVHLDIIRGRPVHDWQKIRSLVDENGAFLGSSTALFSLYAEGRLEHEHVEREWRSQIERILALGVQPSHLTSHDHVHAWPTLTRMIGELACEYGIKWVRKPVECAEISLLGKRQGQTKFMNVCGMFDRETDGVNWTDVFWEFPEERLKNTPAAFVAFLKKAGVGKGAPVVEIGCRPGSIQGGDPVIQKQYKPIHIAAVWRETLASFTENNWLDTFQSLGLTLTGYDCLEMEKTE